jgi:hypothetical protein
MKSIRSTTRAGAAAIVTLALGLAFAPQAWSAGYYSMHVGRDYSRATTSTNNGTWGRSYAQHGSVESLSGWSSVASGAMADSGTSSSYSARVWFK